MAKEIKRDEVNSSSTSGKPGKPFSKDRHYKNKDKPDTTNRTNVDLSTHADLGKPNDPSWYSSDPTLLKNSARISFEDPLGSGQDTFTTMLDKNRNVPGVMILRYIPTVGSFKNLAASPINIAAQNSYSYVRHANSGSRNYEAADLMQYTISLVGLYEYIAGLERLYSLLLTYKSENWYFGRHIVEALGYNFDNLLTNLDDFRFMINAFIRKAGNFAFPGDWTLMARRTWMNLNMFADSPVKKSQIYLYQPVGFYAYDWEHAKVTVLANNALGERVTLDMIETFGNDLFERLIRIEDVGIISGDILKAFGSNATIRMYEIPENFHVPVIYNIEVLNQIHNTTILHVQGDFTDPDDVELYLKGFNIIQEAGILKYDTSDFDSFLTSTTLQQRYKGHLLLQTYKFYNETETGPLNYLNDVLDLVDDDTSEERVMVATRNMAFLQHIVEPQGQFSLYEVQGCGTELFVNSLIITLADNLKLDKIEFTSFMSWNATDAGKIFQYSCAPRLYYGVALGQAYQILAPMINTSCFTHITINELNKMSTTAILAELSIPLYGLGDAVKPVK